MNERIKKWYALYTKPRWEKKVDNILLQKGIESWCPVQKVERQWSDRKKIIYDPLFKSYVFVHITEDERLTVLQTDGALNFVHYLNKPAVIRDEEIELIKSYLLEEKANISVQSLETFKENDKVIIKHGVFMDNTGTVLRHVPKKVYVKLESLQQVMIVEFPAEYVVHQIQRNI
ncbi:MAG TPA: UpxY family transcription antiterminator [Chitinophagaceae bacterium]|jgi:transcription antitermination factor NusG